MLSRIAVISFFILVLSLSFAGEGTITAKRAKYIPSEEKIIGEDVVIKYEDYEIRGDKVTLSLDENSGVVEGNALLIKSGEVMRGEKLFFNWEKEEWKMESGKVEIEAKRLQGAQAPLFLYAKESTGSSNKMEGRNISLTTCSLPHPHYSIDAKELFVLFGDKLVAKDVSFVALGRKLFHLPYLVIPLKKTAQRSFVPEFGSDPYQGYYIKTTYPYLSTAVASGILHLDYIQKRGSGEGIEHSFTYPHFNSSFSLYHIAPSGGEGESLTTNGKMDWQKGSLRASILTDFQKNSLWYGGSSRTSNLQTTIEHNTPLSNLSLSFRQQNVKGFYESQNILTSLLYNIRLDARRNLKVDIQDTSLSYSNSPTDKELYSTFLFSQEGKVGIEIETTRRNDLDKDVYTGDENFSFLEKMPEIRLKAPQIVHELPVDAEIVWGQYRQFITKPFLSRATFSFSTYWRSSQSLSQRNRPYFTLNGEFFQGLYGDGTALYSYNFSPTLQVPIGSSSLNLSFRHITSRGYSPFYMDQVYPYSSLNVGWTLTSKIAKFSLQGGYDFRNDYPYSITGNLEISPTWGNFLFYLGYEPRSKTWRDIIANVKIGEKTKPLWNINIRYATEEKKLAFVRGTGKLELGKWWKIEGIYGYNGYTNKLDELDLALTRDLHCWVASLLYNKRRKELTFNLYLKAFPIQIRPLGLGAEGQYIGTSVGGYY
jgi:lipopolysaccharide export system protein LptA